MDSPKVSTKPNSESFDNLSCDAPSLPPNGLATNTMKAKSLNPSFDDLVDTLGQERPDMIQELQNYRQSFFGWTRTGLLPVEILSKKIWDLECGYGAYSAIFATHSATAVLASDSFTNQQNIPFSILNLPNLQYESGDLRTVFDKTGYRPDLLFFHCSSEHVSNLPNLLSSCFEVIQPGGYLFIAHDNYYQPTGHHDHGFLILNPSSNRVEFQGIECWNSVSKCQASMEHRKHLLSTFAFVWDQQSESKLTPDDCLCCPYFKRSHPWAHLIYQHEFNQVFPQKLFRTANGGLNKYTLYQVRQFLIEAGFQCVIEKPFTLNNEIPAQLKEKFSAMDLLSFYVAALYRKPANL